jgi:hypothetical protein
VTALKKWTRLHTRGFAGRHQRLGFALGWDGVELTAVSVIVSYFIRGFRFTIMEIL